MTEAHRVTGVARLLVGTSAHYLPTPADRRRYYSEFVGELYGLPPAVQFRHAAGVLSQTFALRAALAASHARLEETAKQPFGRRFRCRVLRWHHWKRFSTPDGDRYLACSVCRKEHPNPPHRLAGSGTGGIIG